MYLILFGLIWTFTVRRRAVSIDEPFGAWPKVVGLVSIFVWAAVASLARLIMLLPANAFESIVGS
jgi:hypothetical protein